MPTPSNRTPVRIARGTYSNLNSSVADLSEGEICYATDQDKLYVKEGGSKSVANHVPETIDIIDILSARPAPPAPQLRCGHASAPPGFQSRRPGAVRSPCPPTRDPLPRPPTEIHRERPEEASHRVRSRRGGTRLWELAGPWQCPLADFERRAPKAHRRRGQHRRQTQAPSPLRRCPSREVCGKR